MNLTREASLQVDLTSETERKDVLKRALRLAEDEGAENINDDHVRIAKTEIDYREPYCSDDEGGIQVAEGTRLIEKAVSIFVRKLGISPLLAGKIASGIKENDLESLWFESEFDDWRELSVNKELAEQSRIKCLYCGKPLVLKNGHCQTCGAALEDYT